MTVWRYGSFKREFVLFVRVTYDSFSCVISYIMLDYIHHFSEISFWLPSSSDLLFKKNKNHIYKYKKKLKTIHIVNNVFYKHVKLQSYIILTLDYKKDKSLKLCSFENMHRLIYWDPYFLFIYVNPEYTKYFKVRFCMFVRYIIEYI